MLNYIWAGLIISSLVFALVIDGQEMAQDRYRNADHLPVTLHFPDGYDPDERRQVVQVEFDETQYRQFYDTDEAPEEPYEGVLLQTDDGVQVQFGAGAPLPDPLQTMREYYGDDQDDPIRSADLEDRFQAASGDDLVATTLDFQDVHFRKLQDIGQAALDFAETAASLALSLIGVLALFLGLLKIAEEAGLIYSLTQLVQPVLKPLFPEVPDDHPALAMVSLNLLANVFGLGNAATPLGIKAMEELNEINPKKDTATNSMVMLLALNTSSVQLVPPVLLVAIMGLQVNELVFSITLATMVTTIVGASAAYLLSRTRRNRASNPMQYAPADSIAEPPPSELPPPEDEPKE